VASPTADLFTQALRIAELDNLHENDNFRAIHSRIRQAFATPPKDFEDECESILTLRPRVASMEAFARYRWFRLLKDRAVDQTAPQGERGAALLGMRDCIRYLPELQHYVKVTRTQSNPIAGKIFVQNKSGGFSELPFSPRQSNPIAELEAALEVGGFDEKTAAEVRAYLDPTAELKSNSSPSKGPKDLPRSRPENHASGCVRSKCQEHSGVKSILVSIEKWHGRAPTRYTILRWIKQDSDKDIPVPIWSKPNHTKAAWSCKLRPWAGEHLRPEE
jgi:hypothetical protein